MIRVKGPGALEQQSGFALSWLESTGEILTGHDYFPLPEPAGDVSVQTILSSPFEGTGAAGTMHLIVLQCAHESRTATPGAALAAQAVTGRYGYALHRRRVGWKRRA
jgi:hypothetical protein